MANDGEVLRILRHQDHTLVCQIKGRGSMRQAPAFRRVVEQLLASGAAVLQIDLRYCTYLDSTFLGTLVYFKRAIGQRPAGRFEIVSPSSQCCKLLCQMGLNKVFPIVTAEEPASDSGWTDLTEEQWGGSAFQKTLVEAHQELARLPGAGGQAFRDVAARLTEAWEAEQRRQVQGQGSDQ